VGLVPNIGVWEILIVFVVLLLVFGPKRLPGMGRSLGRGVREFKESVTDQGRELKESVTVTPAEFKDALNPLAPSQPTESEAAETLPEEREQKPKEGNALLE
jgi:sec-independent protein translocase protein TatA